MQNEGAGRCQWCDEPVLDGEPVSPFSGTLMHMECAQRSIIGGANHLLRCCTCCGGTEPSDPPEMTRRQAARFAMTVWRWVQELHEVMERDRRERALARKKPPEGG